MCDELKHSVCVWGYRPYKTVRINLLGTMYNTVPKTTLTDMYGKDWKTPKKFNYYEGIEQGGYKGFLKDYYAPRTTDKKIAFCFLLYDAVAHNKEWTTFFSQDNYPVASYNIYTHLKFVSDRTQDWVKQHKIRGVKNTAWCEETLVSAWTKMLTQALKDKTNKYFVLLSGECIPLFTYPAVSKAIFASAKSRIEWEPNSATKSDTGLEYASQWVILNRKHAKLLCDLVTAKGKAFTRNVKKDICADDGTCYCPDEVYPINWFVHNYGAPTSARFKKEFTLTPTTYTYWDGIHTHPARLNGVQVKKSRRKICKSGALFARKFNNKAAKLLAMTC